MDVTNVGELTPGETATVTFELTVDEDAVEGRYPVHVNVTSDTDVAADQVDGPYLLSVTVEESAGGTTDLTLVGVADSWSWSSSAPAGGGSGPDRGGSRFSPAAT